MLAVTGLRSTIIQELSLLVKDPLIRMSPTLDGSKDDVDVRDCQRFVFSSGVLYDVPTQSQTEKELQKSAEVNLLVVLSKCEKILAANPTARICIVGSESGIKGSYDMTYAVMKAAIHEYVSRLRKCRYPQQLVVIAPPIISDAGMTTRRRDYPEVLTKRRTVTSKQVAELIHHTLYVATPHLTNAVLQMGSDP